MNGFVGRERDLAALEDELRSVRDSGQGSLVLLKGRRRVGKSWLVEEFIERSGLRALYYLAGRLRRQVELARFAEALGKASLPASHAAIGVAYDNWEAALVGASVGATREEPIIIVLDEFPYLVHGDSEKAVEASVNAAWERVLSRNPVMLVVVGSDFSVMTMLTEHDRPLFDRPTLVRTIQPLDVAEFASVSGLTGADAIDAFHVVGGFPRLATSWRPGWSLERFLTKAIIDEDSPIVATGRRILDAEFPGHVQARTVLSVIGAGERTYGNIAHAADVGSSNLKRSLEFLDRQKRITTIDVPLSTARSTETRYAVADPYLRFYLRFIDPGLADIVRGRSRSVVERILRDWQTYIGRTIEPFVRASLERMPQERLYGAHRVGAYWTRANDPEIDLVGLQESAPPRVTFIGSIKWRANARFGLADTRALRLKGLRQEGAERGGVPGTSSMTPLVGVSRSGFSDGHGLSAWFGPDDLLSAWTIDDPQPAPPSP